MSRIVTKKRDVVWSYVGTIVSMGSGFLLLPFLLAFLSDDSLGLWYVYLAAANLTLLFEFGFQPTFARNIVYCISGARSVPKKGLDASSVCDGVDWHLLKTLLKTARLVYAVLALVAFIAAATLGSAYVAYLTKDMQGVGHWVAWAIFCLAIALNLYYLYPSTFLRGLGDIEGENKAKTVSRLVQLVVTIALLACGADIVGAAAGYLLSGMVLRMYALSRFRRREDVSAGLASDKEAVSRDEVKDAFKSVSFIAWRDGVVQISIYVSTQATSILCSLFLGLAATGTYSVLLQLGNAVCSLSWVFAGSHYPAFQSAYARSNADDMRSIVERGVGAYWISFVLGTVGIIGVIVPLLPLFRPGFSFDLPLFLALALYLALTKQHSMFCNFIISMNEIPYVKGYLVAALLGVVLSSVFMGLCSWGVWGLVAGQAISQLLYNNWRWPRYIARYLDTTYTSLLAGGLRWWAGRIYRLIKTLR